MSQMEEDNMETIEDVNYGEDEHKDEYEYDDEEQDCCRDGDKEDRWRKIIWRPLKTSMTVNMNMTVKMKMKMKTKNKRGD